MKLGASARNPERFVPRTGKPVAKSNKQRPRRKTTKKDTRRPSYLPARIIAALRALAATMTNRRDKALLLLLVDSELKPLDLLSLSRGQIRVRFETQVDKSQKAVGTGCLTRASTEPGRKFTIGPEAVEALREYLNHDRVRGDHPALLTERPGERMTPRTLMAMLDDWIRQANDQAVSDQTA